jgi:hypothetical protein
MDIAFTTLVIAPIVLAAAAAVRNLYRSVRNDGLSPRGRSALENAYADRLLRQSGGFPPLPDQTGATLPDARWQRLA